MFRLLNRPPAWMDRAVVQAFRQFTEEFSVVLNDLSGLIERISLLQEEIGARQLEQSNRTLYTLTVITSSRCRLTSSPVFRHERRWDPAGKQPPRVYPAGGDCRCLYPRRRLPGVSPAR